MSRSRKRLAVALLLASLVVLAGCSGSGGDAAGGATDMSYQAGTQAEPAGDAESDGAGADDRAYQSQDRELIRTGEVSLEVADFESARRNLTRATERRGGFVGDSSERARGSGNRTWTAGQVTLRVPAGNYSALFERVKAEGEVRSASTSTEDVTDQLVDMEARLENLRAERDRLRELYESANDTETVLDVQRELSDVQTEIERVEAQRESLERQVRYSTITVELEEERPDEPTRESSAWYETGLLSAFLESVGGVGVVLRGLAVGTAYAAPYALAFGLPVVGAYGAWRRLS